jgi:hypothetical protein
MLYENKSKITLLKLVQQRHFLLKRLYQAVKGRVYMCVRGIDFSLDFGFKLKPVRCLAVCGFAGFVIVSIISVVLTTPAMFSLLIIVHLCPLFSCKRHVI